MGCKKLSSSIIQGIFLNTQEIRNVAPKVPIATLIGPRDYLTVRLCMAWSRVDDCHKQTLKSVSHLQCAIVSPDGLTTLRVCVGHFTWFMNQLPTCERTSWSHLSLALLSLLPPWLRNPHCFLPQCVKQFSLALISPPINLSYNEKPS